MIDIDDDSNKFTLRVSWTKVNTIVKFLSYGEACYVAKRGMRIGIPLLRKDMIFEEYAKKLSYKFNRYMRFS